MHCSNQPLCELDQLDAHKNDTRRTRIVCGSEKNPGVSLDLCGKQNIQLSMEKMLDKPIWHGAYSQALPAMRQRQTLVFQI
jgi:hypothetical protein